MGFHGRASACKPYRALCKPLKSLQTKLIKPSLYGPQFVQGGTGMLDSMCKRYGTFHMLNIQCAKLGTEVETALKFALKCHF